MAFTLSENEIDAAPQSPPLLRLTLWPHRSLDRKFLLWIMLGATAVLTIPLIPVLGSKAIYVLGGFALLDLALLYGLIGLTYRSGRVREIVQIWPDRLRIERIEPAGARLHWDAHPHWVRVELHQTRRIKDYLVLSSAGRSVELGAFLTPEERRSLADRLREALAQTTRAAPAPWPDAEPKI